MDIKKIITDYEKALEEDRQRKELEKQKKIQALADSAETLEAFLKGTVEPVFRAAEADITEMGYPCEIALVSKRNAAPKGACIETLPATYRNFAIEISMDVKSSTGEYARGMRLRYEGDIEKQAVTRSVFPDSLPPDRSRPRPVACITREEVERDVEEFLRLVFKVAP